MIEEIYDIRLWLSAGTAVRGGLYERRVTRRGKEKWHRVTGHQASGDASQRRHREIVIDELMDRIPVGATILIDGAPEEPTDA